MKYFGRICLCMASITFFVFIAVTPALAGKNNYTIAISYFDNTTGQKSMDWCSKGLADMLITDLAKVSSLRVVEREKLESILKEIKLNKSAYFDKNSAQRLGKGLSAEYLLTGSYILQGKELRIDAKILHVESGQIMMTETVTGANSEFFKIEKKLAKEIIANLKVKPKREEQVALLALETTSLKALEKYSTGLDMLDSKNFEGAKRLFEQSLMLDGGFNKARVALQLAKEKRNKALSVESDELLDSINTSINRNDLNSTYYAYRVLRGNYFLAQLQANKGSINKNISEYYDNTMTLIRDLTSSKGFDTFFFIHAEIYPLDEKRARNMGIKTSDMMMGLWDWKEAIYDVKKQLASFLILGKRNFFDQYEINPAPVAVDPLYVDKALLLLKEAFNDIPPNHNYREREQIRTLDLHGDCLLKLNRTNDAIEIWQSILDEYPSNDEFIGIESKIVGVLSKTKKK